MQIDLTGEERATLLLALSLLSIETINDVINPPAPPNRTIDILKEDSIPYCILHTLSPTTALETTINLIHALEWPHDNIIDPLRADAQEIKRGSPHG